MKINYYIILTLCCFSTISMIFPKACLAAKKGKGKTQIQKNIVINCIGFETDSEFNGWKVEKGSLNRSLTHQKQGEYSAHWKWEKGDILSIENLEGLDKATDIYPGGQPEIFEPAFYEKGLYGGLKMWVYQEKASKGQMICQMGSDIKSANTNPKYKFAFNLNFTGWRTIWVQLNEDAIVESYKGKETMHSMIVYPSQTMAEGDIFIDHFNLLEFVSYKRHSDMIFKNNKTEKRVDSYVILDAYKKYQNNKVSDDQNKEVSHQYKTIAKRLEYLILGDNDNSWKKRIPALNNQLDLKLQKAEKTYKKLNITKEGDIIKGLPLFACRDEHPVENSQNFQAIAQATFFPFAIDYRINKNIKSKDKFMNLCEYFADQGWAAGSSMGTVDHIIRLNGFASSIFLMRNDLNPDDVEKQQDMLAWHTRLGNIIDIDKSVGENTDLVRGGAIPKLISILLMPDGAKKHALLSALKSYIDYVCCFAPGFSDTVKPDYSIYHHRGTYLNSYGASTINTLAMIRWILKGTDFSISDKSEKTLKNTLKRQYDIAYGMDIHFGAGGRFPRKNQGISRFMLPAYAFISTTDQEVEDDKMAAIFNYLYKIAPANAIQGILFPALTYSGTFGTVNLMYHLSQIQEDKVLAPAEGTYSMPYSSLLVHRSDNYYTTVKGYSKYIWDYETGHQNENNLGRYQSFGALFTMKTGAEKGMNGAGMNLNKGFHWAYLPGATTKALPVEKLYYINKPTKKYIEGYHRSFTKSTFAGGLNAEGKNGIYAIELRDDVTPNKEMILFDSTFRARKSYFFFGDEIICLGSNINNIDSRYNTITTLFQNNIGEFGIQNKATYMNGKSIGKSLNYKKTIHKGILCDVQGLYYILPKQQNIVLEQSMQQSYTVKGRNYEPISTPHVKAWIDHGKMPKDKGYQYQILMNADYARAEKEYQNVNYEVLQKDATAHIVKHKDMNMTGYAIFNTKDYNQKGKIISVDTPSLIMLKEIGLNMTLSIANPDLNMRPWNHNMSIMPNEIVHADAKASIVSLRIEGLWKPATYTYDLMSVDYVNGNTIIKVYCRDGKTIDIPFRNKN